ncbi:MAG: anti-sigma factor [Phycisphaeraceae bacterium]
MSCKHTSDQLILYLAGVLEAEDDSAIEAHLQQGCTACEMGLAEGRRVLDAIPLALAPREPRPAVRERLLAQLEAGSASRNGALRLVGKEAAPPAATRSRGLVGRVVGACAAAAAVAACVTFVVMDQQVQQQEGDLAQLRETLSQYDQQLVDYSNRAGQLERLAEVAGELYATLRSSPVEMVRMVGVEDEYKNASARLIWDRSRNVGHFVGPEGFRPANGRRLELWLASGDEEALSAGTFSPDEFGWARFDIGMMEVDFSSFDRAYISYDEIEDKNEEQRPRQVLLSGNF